MESEATNFNCFSSLQRFFCASKCKPETTPLIENAMESSRNMGKKGREKGHPVHHHSFLLKAKEVFELGSLLNDLLL